MGENRHTLATDAVSTPKTSAFTSLLLSFKRLDVLLERAVSAAQAVYGVALGSDLYRGLYVSQEEVRRLLAREPGASLLAVQENVTDEDQTASTYSSWLAWLQRAFGLSPFDLDVILIALAPELDLRYERIYAYLQDDVTKKRPSVALMLDLLCPTFEKKATARQRFDSTGPLLSYRLITVFAETPDRHPPLLAQFVKLDERIVAYLLGSDQPDARLLPFVQWGEPRLAWRDLILPEDIKRRLQRLVERYREATGWAPDADGRCGGMVLYLQGPNGVGKQATAEALCGELGIPLLVIDVARLLNGVLSFEVATRLLFREALLQQAGLYFDCFDLLLTEEEKIKQCRQTVIEESERLSGLIILAGGNAWQASRFFLRKTFVRVEFPFPSYLLRKQLWEASLDGMRPPELDLGALANKFRLTAGQVRDAVATARSLALWRDPDNGHLMGEDLYNACRAHSNQRLSTLALKVSPKYTWSDIVLPKEQMTQLRELLNYVKYRDFVYGEWGFEQKLSLGKGLNVLFSGLSGTGKTMAAEIMARELGLDLYKIDLSMVVSKYIGETEKNLSAIFREGKDSNAILFFDEADALFGKRSEVKDAHDRYANVETAYLLQKMEEYEGIVILATNLRNNMDEAFTRRMQAIIDFPYPEEESRRQILEGVFPKQAPLSSDIDFVFLARQFKLTGGNIKNIALHAAFLAAEDGKDIGMAQIIRSMKREYQKLGRLCSKAEFGPYYELTKNPDA